jgi:hypothetical protein
LIIFIIVEDLFEIENGIMGIKRDSFLRLIRCIEDPNKLRAV